MTDLISMRKHINVNTYTMISLTISTFAMGILAGSVSLWFLLSLLLILPVLLAVIRLIYIGGLLGGAMNKASEVLEEIEYQNKPIVKVESFFSNIFRRNDGRDSSDTVDAE